MSIDLNPYASDQEPSEKPESVREDDPAPLNRGLGTLTGSLHGSVNVTFFAVMLLAIAIKMDLFDWLGVRVLYPELGLVFLPIWALPAGILGGLVCGASRGQRLGAAIGIASALPLLYLTSGAYFGNNTGEVLVISTILLLSAIGSALSCHLTINAIVRKRRAVMKSIHADANASPGLMPALFNSAFTVGIVSGVVIKLMSTGPVTEYLSGITAGAGIFGILTGPHLLLAYPNRRRIATVTTITCLLAVLYLIFDQID